MSTRPCGCGSSSTSATCASRAHCRLVGDDGAQRGAPGHSAARAHQPVDPQGYILDLVGEQPEVDEDLIRDERAQAFRAALLELPAGRRELLELLVADPPISYDEISAKLRIPKGSIGPTRARALEQLRNTRAMRALVTASAVVE